MAAASSAQALVLNSCAAGCVTDQGSLPFGVDYTVPSDGRTYRWDLWTDSLNPAVTINLSSPNEEFALIKVSNGDGTFHQDFTAANWIWQETIDPGHTTIFTRSLDADYDHCSNASPLGDACAASHNVWGNGAQLTVSSRAPVTVFFSQTVVPEPAAWTMLILGFFGLGATVRRRRAMAAAA